MHKICRDIVKEYLPIWDFWTGYTNIICSKNSNIPYNLIFKTKFNDSYDCLLLPMGVILITH
jgi:hypothetical protein